MRLKREWRNSILSAAAMAVAGSFAVVSNAAAACGITNYTQTPLSSLSELQRASLVVRMTSPEFNKFKALPPGDPNHYALIAQSQNLDEAKAKAQAQIDTLRLDNGDEYTLVWASDFLNEDQMKEYITCKSRLLPRLWVTGRPESAGVFTTVFAHYLPIGIERMNLEVVAHDNISNVEDLKVFLNSLGVKDFFPTQVFKLKLKDPSKRAVLIMRAGVETPAALYIPPYPSPSLAEMKK